MHTITPLLVLFIAKQSIVEAFTFTRWSYADVISTSRLYASDDNIEQQSAAADNAIASDETENQIKSHLPDPKDVDEWWEASDKPDQSTTMVEQQVRATQQAREAAQARYATQEDRLQQYQEHIERQRKIFDAALIDNVNENVGEEVKPMLRQIARRALRTCIESRAEGRRSRGEEGPDVEYDYTAEEIKERIMYIGGTTVKLVDVGCGTGGLFEYLLDAADAFGVSLEITAFDLSSNMATAAEKHGKKILNLEKYEGNGHKIRVINEDFVGSVMSRSEDGAQSEHFGKYDAVIINSCFGNFFSQEDVMTAAALCLELDGTVCVTHPLGIEFPNKQHEEDPETVPNAHPNIIEFREMIRYHALTPGEFIDSLDVLDKDKKVVNRQFYFACAYRVPHRALKEVIRLRGAVASGYGRGGKKLGVPTANLPESLFSNALEEVEAGVYFGWAVIEDATEKKKGRNKQHKAVVNVGYSPTFEGKENKEKIVEAHLIVDNDVIRAPKDFYNETMRLELIGSIRPEMKFPNFPRLMKAIKSDIQMATDALELQPFGALRADPFLVDAAKRVNNTIVLGEDPWVGKDGGDATASWEFEPITDAIMKTSLSRWVL